MQSREYENGVRLDIANLFHFSISNNHFLCAQVNVNQTVDIILFKNVFYIFFQKKSKHVSVKNTQ